MKKKETKAILGALKRVNLSKIEDKELYDKIIKDHLTLIGVQRKYEEDYDDLYTVFLSAHKADQERVQELQEKIRTEADTKKAFEYAQEINSKDDYQKAVKAFNAKVETLGNEEVEIDKIDMEKFVEEYKKQDYDMGVIEAIYPLFS